MTTTNKYTTEKINDKYEWLWYNDQLRIVHSINDDMFQCQSIIDALHPLQCKLAKDWFANQQTKELLAGFQTEGEFSSSHILYENRKFEAPKLKGYYIHRLLVNFFAMWVCPRYAYKIALILDQYFNKQREEMQKEIKESNEKVKKMIPRVVPKQKEKNYKYLIYTEEVDDKDMIELHLVRRNNRTFSQIAHKFGVDQRFFFRENLPIAMTPNEDIKEIIKNLLPKSEYSIYQSTILTYKEHLPKIHELIEEYFNTFQHSL